MTKLNVPRFTGPLDPPTIFAWLNKCEDVFEGYEALNPGKITLALQILFAGIAMEEPPAAKWWAENCTVLKALTTWLEFETKIKERFNPEGWKVTAVMSYYSIKQGKRDFREFSKELGPISAPVHSLSRISFSNAIFCSSPIESSLSGFPPWI